MAKLQVDDPHVATWLAGRAVQVAHLMRRYDVVQTLWALAVLNMCAHFSGSTELRNTRRTDGSHSATSAHTAAGGSSKGASSATSACRETSAARGAVGVGGATCSLAPLVHKFMLELEEANGQDCSQFIYACHKLDWDVAADYERVASHFITLGSTDA